MTNFVIKYVGLIILATFPFGDGAEYTLYEIDCNNLRMGQYVCPDPDYDLIDPKTQQPRGCTKENKAKGPLSMIVRCKKLFIPSLAYQQFY